MNKLINISELSKLLNLFNIKNNKPNNHILRYWEKEFKEIKPTIIKKRRYYTQKDIELDQTFLEEDENKEIDIDLPDINFIPSNTKEQKRQSLMKLSYDLLSDDRLSDFKIKRQNCILSRQSIKEFLEYKTINIETITSSLTISYLMKTNKNSLEKQIEYYGRQIVKILSEESDAST